MKLLRFLIIGIVFIANVMISAPQSMQAEGTLETITAPSFTSASTTNETNIKPPPPTVTAKPDPLTDRVVKANLIVLGTITAKSSDRVNGKANLPFPKTYPIYTLTFEQVIKGDTDTKEALIVEDTIGLPGDPFSIGDRIVVSLGLPVDGIYYIEPLDSAWVKTSAVTPTEGLPDVIGRIIKILKANHSAIALSPTDEPPLPTGPVQRPKDATILPESTLLEKKDNPLQELPESYLLEQQSLLDAGWNNLMAEDFEGQFPPPGGHWTLNGNPTWDDDDDKPHDGYWSAWCANGGTNGLDPQYSNYPNNMDAWMAYGPFDLTDATAADLDFYRWSLSEQDYDHFQWFASPDNSAFYGYAISGNHSSWESVTFDLSHVPDGLGGYQSFLGDGSVWIAFNFTSDSTIVDKGAFVDDIVLRANLQGPRIDSISPTSGPAGTGTNGRGTLVTIDGQYFGQQTGNSVKFTMGRSGVGTTGEADGIVDSWSPTRIKAYVPPKDGEYIPESGPIKVVTDRGNAQRDFEVTFSYAQQKWPGDFPVTVKYKIDNTNAPAGIDVETPIINAATTWNVVQGANFIFQNDQAATNVISWENISGVAGTSVSPQSGDITSAVTILSSNVQWSNNDPPPQGAFNIQSVVLHELGHWLALWDLYGQADGQVNGQPNNPKVMYGGGQYSVPANLNLKPADIAGIQWIYPGPDVETYSESSVTTNSVTLNGYLTSLGAASSVDVSFQWGTTTSYGNSTSPQQETSTGSFSAGISGLSPNTLYHFRAKAVGDGTAYGEDLTFTTSSYPTVTISINTASSITYPTVTIYISTN